MDRVTGARLSVAIFAAGCIIAFSNHQNGRYQIAAAGQVFVRLDTKTGAVTQCLPKIVEIAGDCIYAP